jgi:hypothetical protein
MADRKRPQELTPGGRHTPGGTSVGRKQKRQKPDDVGVDDVEWLLNALEEIQKNVDYKNLDRDDPAAPMEDIIPALPSTVDLDQLYNRGEWEDVLPDIIPSGDPELTKLSEQASEFIKKTCGIRVCVAQGDNCQVCPGRINHSGNPDEPPEAVFCRLTGHLIPANLIVANDVLKGPNYCQICDSYWYKHRLPSEYLLSRINYIEDFNRRLKADDPDISYDDFSQQLQVEMDKCPECLQLPISNETYTDFVNRYTKRSPVSFSNGAFYPYLSRTLKGGTGCIFKGEWEYTAEDHPERGRRFKAVIKFDNADIMDDERNGGDGKLMYEAYNMQMAGLGVGMLNGISCSAAEIQRAHLPRLFAAGSVSAPGLVFSERTRGNKTFGPMTAIVMETGGDVNVYANLAKYTYTKEQLKSDTDKFITFRRNTSTPLHEFLDLNASEINIIPMTRIAVEAMTRAQMYLLSRGMFHADLHFGNITCDTVDLSSAVFTLNTTSPMVIDLGRVFYCYPSTLTDASARRQWIGMQKEFGFDTSFLSDISARSIMYLAEHTRLTGLLLQLPPQRDIKSYVGSKWGDLCKARATALSVVTTLAATHTMHDNLPRMEIYDEIESWVTRRDGSDYGLNERWAGLYEGGLYALRVIAPRPELGDTTIPDDQRMVSARPLLLNDAFEEGYQNEQEAARLLLRQHNVRGGRPRGVYVKVGTRIVRRGVVYRNDDLTELQLPTTIKITPVNVI